MTELGVPGIRSALSRVVSGGPCRTSASRMCSPEKPRGLRTETPSAPRRAERAALMDMENGWNIVEYRGRDGLLQLETDWRRLCAAMSTRTSYHLFEAHLANVDHLMKAPDELRCLALQDRREVRAICLLQAKPNRILGPPVQVWQLAIPPLMRLRDIICPEDEARRVFIPVLADYLRKRPEGCRLLDLGPLPERSVLWEGLRTLGPGRFATEKVEGMHVIDCSRPYEELVAERSRSFRRDLRRHRKRLDALPDVRFVTVTDDADLAVAYETLLDVESSGWKRAAGSSIRSCRGWPAFFRSLILLPEGGDRCEINELRADGRCIASQLCMRMGAEYVSLKICYDEDYARLAPGLLLLEHSIQRCCQDPDVGRTNWLNESAWQRPWRPDSVAMQHTYVAIGRLSAVPLVALLRLRLGYARRLARRIGSERKRLESWWAGRMAAPPTESSG